jgi:CRISPR-associated protein Csx14
MKPPSIPVDLTNPGQVFASLGFLEAADALLGDAEGGFDWSETDNVRFELRAAGDANPFEKVLEFLASAVPQRYAPIGYSDPPQKAREPSEQPADEDDSADAPYTSHPNDQSPQLERFQIFPAAEGDRMSLPIRLGGGNRPTVEVGHWADGSSRNSFKLYAGNRSAEGIARAMLLGTGESKGIHQLWQEQNEELIARPFDLLTAMGGSFNFDPRGAWTAIDAGYSPNEHGHQVAASPVVELLAAWGLENARPDEFATRKVRYAAWGIPLSPMLARAALSGILETVPLKRFRFELALSGKNKVVTFAELELPND